MKITSNLKKVIIGLVMASCMFIEPVHSQQVFDVVTIGPGYTDQDFYSMQNGTVSTVSNTNWDLAFQISGFQATILINSKNDVRLFKSGFDVNTWATLSYSDTIGVLNSSNELFNQDTSWWSGAFNITANPADPFDLGWGNYDFATHVVVGDSIYFMKLPGGAVKKVWIQALQNSVYQFAYADVDGSNEVNASLNKTNYAGKNFGYYSIINSAALDREPNKYTWDLTFMQYVSTAPILYKVTGVLSNDSVQVARAYPVDVSSANPWDFTYSWYINTIGYDWKIYDFNTNSWSIADSLVYFVADRNGQTWKLIFTAFGGALTGDYAFIKEPVGTTGFNENNGEPVLLSVYPNPASSSVQLVLNIQHENSVNVVDIYSSMGMLVKKTKLESTTGLQQVKIDITDLASGHYFVAVAVEGRTFHKPLVINR